MIHRKCARHKGSGFVPIELLAVISVIAVLLGLGIVAVRNARQQAYLAQAEGRLKQVSIALDLYFQQNGSYPPPGYDLSLELSPYLRDKKVLKNCIGTIDISDVYESLDLQHIDEPENYITGFYADDGKTMVLLKTMGKIVRKTGYSFNPRSHTSAKFAGMSAVAAEYGETVETVTDTELQEGRVVRYTLDCDDKKKGVSIKFQAAGDQLGEDGATEYDRFSLQVEIDGDGDIEAQPVAVTVKAGASLLVPDVVKDPGSSVTFGDLLGKVIPLVSVPGNNEETGWAIRVNADRTVDLLLNLSIAIGADGRQTHAVSHVDILLEGGARVLNVLPPLRFYGTLE
jgi:type II secretory pathway pseudopilin PulG